MDYFSCSPLVILENMKGLEVPENPESTQMRHGDVILTLHYITIRILRIGLANKANLMDLYPWQIFLVELMNPISPNHKITLSIIQINVKSLLTSFQWLVQ